MMHQKQTTQSDLDHTANFEEWPPWLKNETVWNYIWPYLVRILSLPPEHKRLRQLLKVPCKSCAATCSVSFFLHTSCTRGEYNDSISGALKVVDSHHHQHKGAMMMHYEACWVWISGSFLKSSPDAVNNCWRILAHRWGLNGPPIFIGNGKDRPVACGIASSAFVRSATPAFCCMSNRVSGFHAVLRANLSWLLFLEIRALPSSLQQHSP